jgi:hypothetical protein
MPVLNFPLNALRARAESRAARATRHPHIRITPFGAAVPARPMPRRRAAPVWLFRAVAIGWCACICTGVTLVLAFTLMTARLIEIERALELAARV